MVKGGLKYWLWFLFRFVLVIGIFIYLIKTNLLDLQNLKNIVLEPNLFFLAMVFAGLGTLVNVQRLRVLLKAQDFSLEFWTATQLTFIGVFFNSVIPGTVSGDIVKAYYLGKGQEKKTELATTIFFDRILGLYAVAFIAAMGATISFLQNSFAGQAAIWGQPKVQMLGSFALINFLLLTFLGVVFTNQKLRKSKIVSGFFSKMPFKEIVSKVNEAVCQFAMKPRLSTVAFLLAVLAQVFILTGILCLLTLLKIKALGLINYLFAVPLCLLINSIPITPGGLGIGEIGFQAIFELFNSNKGAELAVLFHALFLIFNIGVGGVFYMSSDISRSRRQQVSVKEKPSV